MSIDTNKLAIYRLLEAASMGKMEVLDELLLPELVIHGAALFPFVRGREALKTAITAWVAAFPDATFTIERIFAEADKVVTHIIVSGTHQGNWLGAAPTGKTIVWTASAIARLADDQIVELWAIEDELGIRQQLGSIAAFG